jgi:putative integral membrane protein (TIGR02587 family)
MEALPKSVITPLARAFGGAIVFALPLLMTMEMWWLGFYIDPFRLALFILMVFPFLVGLSYHAGFEETFNWKEDVADALIAYAIGFLASAIILAMLGILHSTMAFDEAIGKISLQAVPASMGAVLARTEFGIAKADQEEKTETARYFGEIFLMAAGGLFLAFNIAPTEEMILITYTIANGHALIIVAVSLLILHSFSYALGFRGQTSVSPGTQPWFLFFRSTVVGYAVCLVMSAYVLWTFGRFDDISLREAIVACVVLSFPASLGAAAARLIL